MGIHPHEPVRCVDPIVAALRAHVGVARENRAVQHQHVSPNMNMRPYIGDESGNQLVPEPSRLIGSATSIEECISICMSCISCDACAVCDAMSFSRPRVRRWLFDVRRSAFLLFQRHEFHPAFRTISRMVGYNFRMHQTGVLLRALVLVIVTRAIEVP